MMARTVMMARMTMTLTMRMIKHDNEDDDNDDLGGGGGNGGGGGDDDG